MAKRDYYEVLGVNKSATPDQIKSAYRKLAVKHHPDKNKGDKAAEEKFKEASEAYHVLSNSERKQNYDNFGHAAFENGGGGGGTSFPTTTVISSSTNLFIGKTDAPYISGSQGNLELSGSGTVSQIQVDHRYFDTGSATVSAAGGAMGDTIKFGDSSGLTPGKVYYLESDGTWDQTDANNGGKCFSLKWNVFERCCQIIT